MRLLLTTMLVAMLAACMTTTLNAAETTAAPKYVIVCSHVGPTNYEAFPDVCRTKSGDLLCVFYAGYAHVSHPNELLSRGGRIAMCRSTDDGKTWSPATIVVDTPLDDRDPSIVELPGGDLLITSSSDMQRSPWAKSFTVRSTDGGKTWGEPKAIPTPFTQAAVVSTPARLMPDGRLLLPLYGNDAGDPRMYTYVAVVESRDLGHTWSTLAKIKPTRKSSRYQDQLQEPDIIRLPDESLFMMIRPTMTWSRSTDGGKTWSKPKDVGIQGDAPYLLLTSKNILLCGIRYCPWSSTCVIHSADFGRTWSKPVVIDRVPGAYPSMVELPDGRILVVYYTEGKEDDIRCLYLRADKSGVRVVDCR